MDAHSGVLLSYNPGLSPHVTVRMNLDTRHTEHVLSFSEVLFLLMSLAKREADRPTHESRIPVLDGSLPFSYTSRPRGICAVLKFSWSNFTGPRFGPILDL